MNEEGKGEKYLEKEDIWSAREMKLREGKEGNIWRGKVSHSWRKRKRRKIQEEGKHLIYGRNREGHILTQYHQVPLIIHHLVRHSQLNNLSFYDSFDESRTVYLV